MKKVRRRPWPAGRRPKWAKGRPKRGRVNRRTPTPAGGRGTPLWTGGTLWLLPAARYIPNKTNLSDLLCTSQKWGGGYVSPFVACPQHKNGNNNKKADFLYTRTRQKSRGSWICTYLSLLRASWYSLGSISSKSPWNTHDSCLRKSVETRWVLAQKSTPGQLEFCGECLHFKI